MNNTEKFAPWFGLFGKMKIKNGYVEYSSPYARSVRVRLADIETVTIDQRGWGKTELRIVGKGTDLAKIPFSGNAGNKYQEWLLSKIQNV